MVVTLRHPPLHETVVIHSRFPLRHVASTKLRRDLLHRGGELLAHESLGVDGGDLAAGHVPALSGLSRRRTKHASAHRIASW